jgi:adenylate cyclase
MSREATVMAARSSLRRLDRTPAWAAALALGAAAAGALVGARAMGLLEPLELGAYDRALRLGRPARDDPRIALVEIRESDMAEWGHPLTDAVLARVLAVLSSGRPRAIGVDLYRDRPVPPGEEDLRRVVSLDPGIVVVEKIADPDAGPIAPPAWLAGGSQVGFSDVKLDADGVVRRGLLAMAGEGSGGLSLALRLALRSLAADRVLPRWARARDEPLPALFLGGQRIPRFGPDDGGYVREDAAGYQVLLDYRSGRARYARFGLDEVLAASFEAGRLRDRIVIVGNTSASVRDVHATPFGRIFGLEHHAHVTGQLLDAARGERAFVRTLPDAAEHALVLLAGLAGAALAVTLRSPLRLGSAGVAGLAGIGAGAGLAFVAGWWLPVVPAALAWLGAGAAGVAFVAFAERARREDLRALFGRFLADDVAAAIWRDRDAFMDGGRPVARQAVITVLMADLQGYTAAAEKLEPPRLMEWINAFLERMARTIGAHGGVVNDYTGDGLMAAFGVPLLRTDAAEVAADAARAVACALAMGAGMERLNRDWAAQGLPTGRVRIGVCTGPAIVGMVGSRDRLKYTALGDTVNVAARLESHDREGFAAGVGGPAFRVLVADATRRLLGDTVRAEELGRVVLKGRTEAVAIHRILGCGGEEESA